MCSRGEYHISVWLRVISGAKIKKKNELKRKKYAMEGLPKTFILIFNVNALLIVNCH